MHIQISEKKINHIKFVIVKRISILFQTGIANKLLFLFKKLKRTKGTFKVTAKKQHEHTGTCTYICTFLWMYVVKYL